METRIDFQHTSDKNHTREAYALCVAHAVCMYMYHRTAPSAYSAPSDWVSLSTNILRARSNAGHRTGVSSHMDRLQVDIYGTFASLSLTFTSGLLNLYGCTDRHIHEVREH